MRKKRYELMAPASAMYMLLPHMKSFGSTVENGASRPRLNSRSGAEFRTPSRVDLRVGPFVWVPKRIA